MPTTRIFHGEAPSLQAVLWGTAEPCPGFAPRLTEDAETFERVLAWCKIGCGLGYARSGASISVATSSDACAGESGNVGVVVNGRCCSSC